MDIERLSAYLPMDRRHALATGRPLPDRTEGAALLADIVGFTPLADGLVTALGARRGAEELTRLLNAVYGSLIAQVHRYGGSVVSFVGDGLICWFAGDAALRAVACGLAMQQAISSFSNIEIPGGSTVSFSMKVGVAAGPVRRFVVGDPEIQRLDVTAGATLDRMAQAEGVARQGEIIAGPQVVRQLGHRLRVTGWRGDFAVVQALTASAPPAPWPDLNACGERGRTTRGERGRTTRGERGRTTGSLTVEQVRPYLLPPVYEQLAAGQGEFLAELRPAVMLFLRFGGVDYDRDDAGLQLDAYVAWVQGVLRRYDGYLIQLTIGDKGSFLYTAFGPLAVHEDDAERAVAAGLELQQVPPESDLVTEVQIGISRGRVRAGAYGSQVRRTYGAIGDEVNVACRLMEAAPAGEVRCSRRVYQAVRGRWAFEPLPPVQVKGKEKPLPIYRPLRQTRERAVRVAGTLVGRRAEMETLTRLLGEAQSGQRRVLLLEGEAGIGKSRLVDELAQLAHRRGVAWLMGAGQSIEQRTPYRAWQDLLAAYFRLSEQMDLAERQRRVQEQVTDVNPTLAERTPLLNDILRLGLPETDLTRHFDPKLRHESLTALVLDLLRAATADGPLAMVLEDGHWLDSLSWELALSVARALSGQPLLLTVALRPLEEPLRAEYTALVELEDTETLCLETMPPVETVALAAARLGIALSPSKGVALSPPKGIVLSPSKGVTPDALPDEVADLVRERAGGNPFFAEELAYALRDSGLIVIEEGQCSLTGDLATLKESVPDTVEGVVLSRIDRLSPEEQLTLKVAAVIGRSFLYRTLHDVHPRQIVADLLQAHLDDLAWRGLTPLEALEPELSYIFKHIITQQVAYDTLLFSQRRDLHRTVAGWYEQRYADNLSPYYPLLVHHWNRAEDAEQERHYAKLAGEQAAAQFANAEAVAYFSRALKLTPEDDLAARFDLRLAREKMNALQGERAAQVEDLAALEMLAERLNDDQRRAVVALQQADYHQVTSSFIAAAEFAQTVVKWAAQTGDPTMEVAGHVAWGRAQWLQTDYILAQERYERALVLAQAVGDQQGEADCWYNLGVIHADMRDFVVARDHCQRALAIRVALGDRWGEAKTIQLLGGISSYMGDRAANQSYWEQSLAIYRTIGHRLGESYVLYNLSVYYRGLGEGEKARRCCEEAMVIARALGERRIEAYALTYLGLILERLHTPEPASETDLATARSHYTQALSIRREIGQPALAIDSQAGLARVALAQEDLNEALRWVEEILGWISQNGIDGIGDVILVYQTAYRVFSAAGQTERAKAALTDAYNVLMEWADGLLDKEARRSMLEDVWPHGEIVAAYRAMQAADESE